MYIGGNNVIKDDKNGLLSCGIYSSPAAARLLLQRLGRRSLPRSLDMYYGIHGLERVGCVHLTYINIIYTRETAAFGGVSLALREGHLLRRFC